MESLLDGVMGTSIEMYPLGGSSDSNLDGLDWELLDHLEKGPISGQAMCINL